MNTQRHSTRLSRRLNRRPFELRRHHLALAAAMVLGALPFESTQAATCTWVTNNGAWNVGANWSCGTTPGGSDTAVVGSGLTANVSAFQATTTLNNSGTVNVLNNSGLSLQGSNTNNGTLSLGSAGNLTDLSIVGVSSLLGTGTVSMSNTQANRILASGGAATLTLGAGQTVQGAAQFGAGTALSIVNNGLVQATQTSGLVINTSAGVTNNATLRANGGTLVLQNTAIAQGVSGVIEGLAGSTAVLSNSTVTGGSFAGEVETASGAFGNVLSGVTNTGTLRVVNNSGLTLGGTLTNNGTLALQSAGNITNLVISGAQSIVGSGTITMSNTQANRITGAGATFTLGSGQTLQGAGQIGGGAAGFSLVNQGTIVATQAAGLLINAAGGVTNTGTLRADGGTLQLQTTVNSSGGAIEARNGSQVQLLDGTVINNASFSASGAGSLITTVSGASVTLGGGTVAGPIQLANNSFATLTGNLVYNGTLSMASAGNVTDLRISGARTISGSATIDMSNTTANRVLAANASGDSLTLASGVTLRGSGQLGNGGPLAITNNGTVLANQSTPLLVSTSAGLVNNGVMRADGGTLQFSNVSINSTNGSIEALNGSQVQLLNGTVVTNATLLASGAGSAIAVPSGNSATLAGGTLTGSLLVENNASLRMTGNVSGNATLSLASAGNLTNLEVVGTRALTGSMTVNMSNTSANRIFGTAADTLTTGAGVLVQGAGQIGGGTALNVVNSGTWLANQPSALTLRTTGSATNNNLIRADGSTFQIAQTQLVQGPSGVLSAINNGVVSFIDGARVTGGSFATANGGEMVVGSGQSIGIGGVNNTGTFSVQNNGELVLRGALSNNGVLNLQSAGNATNLRVDGNQQINGTGVINLSNTAANVIRGLAAGDSLTLGAGQTLRGAGSIGQGTNFVFTNNGTVVGDLASALVFSSTGAVTNNNQVRADGGNVVITATNFGQGPSGVLSAINGGVVSLQGGAVISGGLLSTASGGQITTVSGNTATLSNLVSSGTFNVVNNSDLILAGTVTNNGALNVTSAGNSTDLRISGSVTLAGSGTTSMSNTTTNRVVANAAGAQLTLGAGQTLQGAGQIGAGTAMSLNNLGTITANQPTALTVSMTGTASNGVGGLMQATAGTLNVNMPLINNGTLAANGGTVNANGALSGTGTVLVTGTGQMNIGASGSTGTLTHNGTAANGLALGANNLTVNTDYTNANAGTGNTFNRRANVTGTGQILAGGNVGQVITGANVSGGNTANATLTIGNLRVGSNTFNYQVANAGTTGPTLRGALQTSVNGANITDARLSGSGVTAANYNAGAPAGSSGNLAVVFNAASAGALAPLSGQAINLRSNFENIADQKLNIVLAGGAAAYNPAAGSAGTPVQVANQRVGGSNSATLLISNTAIAGPFSEDLNASVAGSSGAASGSGSVAGRLAGTSNTGVGAISVGVNTASAGAKTGTVNIDFQTAGAVGGASNGLGIASAGSQAVTVNGNVFQAAAGQIVTPALNFGTLQVGQQVSQALVVRNTAAGPAGFVEDLNASFGAAGNAQISGVGSLSGILAGSNSNAGNGAMTVTVTGTTAGALNSGIAVNYTTAGAVAGVSNGLGTASVGSENYGVNGTITALANVINQASPLINNPSINLGAVRVGAASPTALVSLSNQATAAPQAALNASIATAGAPVTTNAGMVSLLLPGQTNASSLQVGLATDIAGNFTGGNAGTAVLTLVSDASNVGGCAPNCQLELSSQNVTVSGKVYTPAVGALATTSVDFGVVRVGDTVMARNITVTNMAASTALNDTLRATLSGVGGPFSGGGAVAGVAAQGSGNIAVGLNTSTAGVFSQGGSVGFLSQNADMADVSGGAAGAVQVNAQVNNLANADFDFLGGLGLLTQLNATDFVLDLGNLLLGATVSSTLGLSNDVAGPADVLGGAFDLSAVNDFSLDADWLQTLAGLQAGDGVGSLDIDFFAGSLGAVSDEVIFNGRGTNASDPNGLAQVRRLIIRANVITDNGGTVPEPGSLMLVLAAAVAALIARRRRGVVQ